MRVQNENIKEIKKEARETVISKKKTVSFTPVYEVEMSDRLDFIMTKTLKTTKKTLVFLFSQKLFYFYSEPSEKTEEVDAKNLQTFFAAYDGELKLSGFDDALFSRNKKESLDYLMMLIKVASKTPEEKVTITLPNSTFGPSEIHDADYEILSSFVLSPEKYRQMSFWTRGKLNALREIFVKSKKFVLMANQKLSQTVINWQMLNILYGFFGYNIVQNVFMENYSFRKAVLGNFYYHGEKAWIELIDIAKKENYEPGRLAEYILSNLLAEQLSDTRTLVDTLALQKNLYGEIRYKYPKNVDIMHQTLAREASERNQNGRYEEQFKARMKDLPINYSYQREKYQIIVPQSGNDLVQEGTALCHCVAEYVSKVANGDCVVLFLRERKNIKKPFLTIEVQNGAITQVEGYQRSINVTSEIYKFLEDFAKKKNLKIETFLNIVD